MTAIIRSKGSLKWYLLACILAVTVGVGFTAFNSWSTTQDKYTAQANAEVLAKDIVTICATEGKLMVNNRDVCAKGEDVLANPTEPIPGPKGEAGKDGVNGKDGLNGANGKDGLDGKNGLPGKDGKDGSPGVAGKDGLNGADGKDGLNGTNGVDGTNGTNGTNGTDGKDGEPPSSFTWTDSKTGTKYTCVPDPVGSTTYSCTATDPAPPNNPILP